MGIVSFSRALIARYGLKAYMLGLWLCIMIGFALLLYLMNMDGAFFLSLKSTFRNFIGLSLPLGKIFSWVSWAAAGLAGMACVYILGVRMSSAEADPLFAPKLTAFLLIILFRFSWEISGIRATIILMLVDSSGICQLIMTIMSIGLGACTLQFLSLRNEYRGFLRARSDAGRISFHDEKQAAHVMEVMDETQGLLRRKWENLKNTIKYAQHGDFDALTDFPDQHELLKEGKISFIIKILPILGIVGTVAGFTLAVVGMLDAAADMNDFYSFKANLIASLGGMKSAFLTTLAGMVAMVLVMWLNVMIEDSRRRVLLIEAEFLYVRIFLPWLWLLKNGGRPPERPDGMLS